MSKYTPEKLHGLSLTAAVQICSHPEIAIILGGSEDRRNPIDVIAAIIEDTLTKGLDFTPVTPSPSPYVVPQELKEKCWICHKPKGQPPDRCPGHYDMGNVLSQGLIVGLEPLDIQCVCGHRYRDHYQDGKCHECQCRKFDSGYTEEEPHHIET